MSNELTLSAPGLSSHDKTQNHFLVCIQVMYVCTHTLTDNVILCKNSVEPQTPKYLLSGDRKSRIRLFDFLSELCVTHASLKASDFTTVDQTPRAAMPPTSDGIRTVGG